MYIDDLRTPIKEFDFIARSYDEAVSTMSTKGVPSFISFNHDLGCRANGKLLKSGFDVVKWIVSNDMNGKCQIPEDFTYKVHSQNPVGKKNIESLLGSYLNVKNKKEK